MEQFIIIALLVLLQVEIAYFIWSQRFQRKAASSPVFIDTSVLIDGRIMALQETGFLPGSLYIPRSVLAELQLLADGSDSDRRTRARHGLDVAAELTRSGNAAVFNDSLLKSGGVDEQLLALARKHDGTIFTIDFNLNKVATVEGITVLNMNELARQLRMEHLPGEVLKLAIIQKGNDASQGVGYLEDGTMVVVEQAAKEVGKTIEIEFIRSIQTAAGRMMFAKKRAAKSQESKKNTHKKLSPSRGRAPSGNRKRPAQRKSPEDSLIELVETTHQE